MNPSSKPVISKFTIQKAKVVLTAKSELLKSLKPYDSRNPSLKNQLKPPPEVKQ
jgi:hypothetical protein